MRPPITDSAIRAWGHVLAAELTVSGSIRDGDTTSTVTYFVVDKVRNAVVGNIMLPDASRVAHSFKLNVMVPGPSDEFDVGTFDDDGNFKSAGFAIEPPATPTGAEGPRS